MIDVVAIRARFEANRAWFESVPWLKADAEALLQQAESDPHLRQVALQAAESVEAYHHAGCAIWGGGDGCDCGLWSILKSAIER